MLTRFARTLLALTATTPTMVLLGVGLTGVYPGSIAGPLFLLAGAVLATLGYYIVYLVRAYGSVRTSKVRNVRELPPIWAVWAPLVALRYRAVFCEIADSGRTVMLLVPRRGRFPKEGLLRALEGSDDLWVALKWIPETPRT